MALFLFLHHYMDITGKSARLQSTDLKKIDWESTKPRNSNQKDRRRRICGGLVMRDSGLRFRSGFFLGLLFLLEGGQEAVDAVRRDQEIRQARVVVQVVNDQRDVFRQIHA